MKIQLLTTVYSRPLIELAMHYMKELVVDCKEQLHIDLIPFYVLSEYDPDLKSFESILDWLEMDYCISPDKHLSDKTQFGFSQLKNREFDYLMHLDSDEIISMDLITQWYDHLSVKNPPMLFGTKDRYMYEVEKMVLHYFPGYKRHPVCNGAFCIHRSVLEKVNWMPYIKGLDSGINVNEYLTYKKNGYSVQTVTIKGCLGLIELKGTMQEIHPIEWYKKNYDITSKEIDETHELFQCYPGLYDLLYLSK